MMRRYLRWLVAGILLGGATKICMGFVGVPILFAPPVLTTATGIALSTWAAIAGGIGALLFSIGLQDSNGNEFVGVRVNPNAPQKVPAGWAAGTGGADPVPPANVAATLGWVSVNFQGVPYSWATGFYPDAVTACTTVCVGSGRQFGSLVPVSSTSNQCMCTGSIQFGWVNQSAQCPTGYSSSGSSCVLSNAPAVRFPPDSRCGLTLSGGVISYDSRDPDCDGTAPAQIVKSTDGKTVTATNTNSTQQIKIQVNTDGSVQVTSWTPSTNGSIATTVDTVSIGAPTSPASSQIQSVSQGTITGQGTGAFQTTPTSSPQSFPDDYSREATQQSVLTKLGEVKTALENLTEEADEPADPEPVTPEEITEVFFPETFTSLRSWQMPTRAVSCPTWSFAVFSHSYTIDTHCTLIEQQRGTFSAIMLLIWSIAALFIVLGA